MRWSFQIGRIAGIRVELHVTFLLFVGWIAVSQGLQAHDAGRALAAVTLLLLVFACVLLHELGHALAARRYGIRTREIVLLPIGGVARVERMPEKPQQELVVAAAGPAVNVVLAMGIVALMAALHYPLGNLSLDVGVLDGLLLVNVMMVVFNLIPAFPMDGGRVLRALLALRLPYTRATRIASTVGQGFALLFALVGLFYNPMLLFIALFVFMAAGEERALVQTRASLEGLPVRAAMLTDLQVLEVGDPLQRAVEHLVGGSQQDFPVMDGERLVGMLSRSDLILALQRAGAAAPVGDVMAMVEDSADPGEPLDAALQRMRQRQRTALPVLSRGRLVGLLTMENVGDLVVVQDALQRYAGGSR